MDIHEEIRELEDQIKIGEELVERRAIAQRLEQNPDFRKMFIEGYFLEDAARLVQMSTDPRISDDIRASCLEEARATGYMRRYLSDSIQQGSIALNALPEQRAALVELRIEADKE